MNAWGCSLADRVAVVSAANKGKVVVTQVTCPSDSATGRWVLGPMGRSQYAAGSSGHCCRSRGTWLHLPWGKLMSVLGGKQHKTGAKRQEWGFLCGASHLLCSFPLQNTPTCGRSCQAERGEWRAKSRCQEPAPAAGQGHAAHQRGQRHGQWHGQQHR